MSERLKEKLKDEEVKKKKEKEKEMLNQKIFEFCIALLKQKVAFNVYVNPLLHFTAVLGIDATRYTWKQAKDYTGQLAELMWCGRMLMLEHIFKDQPDDPEQIGVDMVEQFKDRYQRWLADGSNTPFSTMTRWMSYGKGFRRKEGGTAKVLWEEDGKALRYLGQQIEVQEFQGAVNAGVDEAETLLDRLMFGKWAEVKELINMHQIIDSLMFEGQDGSFVMNGKNDWLQLGHEFLAQRGRQALWKAGHQDGGWRVERVADYLKKLRAFKLIHLTNMHI